MIALHPDPVPGGRSQVTYVAYTAVLPGVDAKGRPALTATGRRVLFRCVYPVVGPRRCVKKGAS